MSLTIQQRIAAFVQWRLDHPRTPDESGSPQVLEQRLARERMLAEIPLLRERLANAVSEINDSIADADVHLKMEDDSKHVTLEASFKISMWPDDDEASTLDFNVAHEGQLVVLMARGGKITRLNAVEIRAADRPFLLDALVSFLEIAAT